MKSKIIIGGILFCLIIFLWIGCDYFNRTENISLYPIDSKYISSIDSTEIKKELYIFSSNKMKGREAGTFNEKLATDYLVKKYSELNISPAENSNSYLQEIPIGTFTEMNQVGHNVIAQIKGNEKSDEYIVISAHLDHLGQKDNEIYNGADDDGSGTISVLNIAKAFKNAEIHGKSPKRNILFLHVTGEEKGLLGSKFFTDNPIISLNKIVANLNIDMIGRIDKKHTTNIDYLYLIGSKKLSPKLGAIAEKINSSYFNIKLDYTYDEPNHPDKLYYRSDHYNFAKNNIPVIFFFSGIHDDYHRPTDTPDKINYPLLTKRTQYIFSIAWELANRENPLDY